WTFVVESRLPVGGWAGSGAALVLHRVRAVGGWREVTGVHSARRREFPGRNVASSRVMEREMRRGACCIVFVRLAAGARCQGSILHAVANFLATTSLPVVQWNGRCAAARVASCSCG